MNAKWKKGLSKCPIGHLLVFFDVNAPKRQSSGTRLEQGGYVEVLPFLILKGAWWHWPGDDDKPVGGM